MSEFKVIIVGDGSVGKSAFVHMLKCDKFKHKYIATMGAEVHPITFNTTKGNVCLKIWDTAGQEKFSGLREAYYVKADAAILMYDMTSKDSYEKLTAFNQSVIRVCCDIPRYVVGCKSDIVSTTNIDLSLQLPHCTISNLTCNVEDPIKMILKDLTGGIFIASPTSISNY